MKNAVAIACVCCLVVLTGCEDFRAAARSRANQGLVLGGVLGAGILGAIGAASEHHHGLGAWAGAGAALGALAGWFAGHQLDQQAKHSQ